MSEPYPLFGVQFQETGTRFRFWAPDCRAVALCLDNPAGAKEIPLIRDADGWYETVVPGAGAGTRYCYRIDGDLRVPDPASRFQPDDVHGVSEIIDPQAYVWQAADWRGRPWSEAIVYELHVGTFSPEGTFRGVIDRLDSLVDLGVTAIELMPVADFPGDHDWGYNGALIYAPDSRYGRPEDLRALIDAAHSRGLMVFLDVVYNHFGPEGNYLHVYAERFFDADQHTPWGAAIAFSGPNSRWVRAFFIENAIYWLRDYRFDGLRLDAVHAIDDPSPTHILDELADRVRAALPADRHVHLVLENDANQARFLRPDPPQRAGYAAQWNDDWHHAAHVLLTGETDGYYGDYADDPGRHMARCLTAGFAYQGEPSPHRGGERRGEKSDDLPPMSFVAFLQNHDQVGNRAFGERLTRLAPPEALRAAAAMLLLAPSPPLLFMGEEWAALEPFPFFCDLGPDLQEPTREGRRREFAGFPQFRDPEALAKIPDATAEATYRSAILDWQVRARPEHASMLDHYRSLLAIRRRDVIPRLPGTAGRAGRIRWREGPALSVDWQLGDGSVLILTVNFSGTARPGPGDRDPAGRTLFDLPTGSGGSATLPPWAVSVAIVEAA